MRRLLPAAGVVLLVACGGAGAITVPRPIGFTPGSLDSAAAWAAGTAPTDRREIRFRWQIQDDQGAGGGRGRVRFAPPDSARLDVQGSLGIGRTAAFVKGDTAVWAEPESDVKRLVPSYELFWALLGIARPPTPATAVQRSADPTVAAWQYQRGTDTVDYVRIAGPPARLITQVRQSGMTVGTVETTFDADGSLKASRLIVPSVPARVDITFSSNQKVASLAPDTWVPLKY